MCRLMTSQCMLLIRLEDGGCIGEPKQHHAVLIASARGVKRHLPFVPLLYTDQVVGIAEVQFFFFFLFFFINLFLILSLFLPIW